MVKSKKQLTLVIIPEQKGKGLGFEGLGARMERQNRERWMKENRDKLVGSGKYGNLPDLDLGARMKRQNIERYMKENRGKFVRPTQQGRGYKTGLLDISKRPGGTSGWGWNSSPIFQQQGKGRMLTDSTAYVGREKSNPLWNGAINLYKQRGKGKKKSQPKKNNVIKT